MPTRLIFRCEFCAAAPDPATQLTLERQLRELSFGAYLEHYGTVAPHPWKMPPYPTSVRSPDTERAIRHGGLSAMPKWGLW
jgi:hypothetical protein